MAKKSQSITLSVKSLVTYVVLAVVVLGVFQFVHARKQNAVWQILSFRDNSDQKRAIFTLDYPQGMTATQSISSTGFPNGVILNSHPFDSTIVCNYTLQPESTAGKSIEEYVKKVKLLGTGTEQVPWTPAQAATFSGKTTSRKVGEYTGYTLMSDTGEKLSGDLVFGKQYVLEFRCTENNDTAHQRRFSDKMYDRLPASTVERIEQSLKDL